jgi:DNA mismatch repair protein MLH1
VGFHVSATLLLGTVAAAKSLRGTAIFVNGRLVRCDRIKKSIDAVYSEFLMKGEHPFFVVMLRIPSRNVDVNVHPTKRDVTFAHADQIANNLAEAIRSHLSAHAAPRKFATEKQETIESSFSTQESQPDQPRVLAIPGSVESEVVTVDDPPPEPPRHSQPNDPVREVKPARPLAKMALFDELKYEPLSPPMSPESRLMRGDHRERTIEEVVATSAMPARPPAPFREIEVSAITKLRKQISQEADESFCSLFRKLIFVGPYRLSHVLFSSDDILYLCSLFPLTRILFYQLFVARFGNMGRIEFSEPIEIDPLIQLIAPDTVDGALVLMRSKELLADYFAIVVEHGRLAAMPNVLPGYVPSFTALPLFLYRLATEVNWDYEFDCICEIISELSMLYSILPEDAKDEEQKARLEKELGTVVMPVMKTDAFLPPTALLEDTGLRRLASVAEMYSIFERT